MTATAWSTMVRARARRRASRGLALSLLAVLTSMASRAPALADPEEAGSGIHGTVFVASEPVEARVFLRLLRHLPERVLLPWTVRGAEAAFVAATGRVSDAGLRGASDARGRFAFEGLAAGNYAVEAVLADGRRQWTSVALDPGQWAGITLVIPRQGHALHGRVTHGDGTPFRGRVVAIRMTPGAERSNGADESLPVEPDAEGRFRFTGLGAGPYALAAFAPGRWVSRSPTVHVPYEGAMSFVVDAGLEAVRGTVRTPDGRPVPGAEVWLTRDGRFITRTLTDDRGRYQAMAHPESLIRAYAGAHAAPPLARAPHAAATDLLLGPGRRIRGTVTDGEGQPREGIPIFAVRREAAQYDEWAAAAATSGPDGGYALEGLAPGDYLVFARGAGWLSMGAWSPFGTKRAMVGGKERPIDLTVERGARVVGEVRDAEGAPVRGALAQVTLFEGVAVDHNHLIAAVSDVHGRFELDALRPHTTYNIEVRPPGLPPRTREVRTPASGELRSVRWDLPPVVRHPIRVQTADGTPIPGAQVNVASMWPNTEYWHELGSVGAEGEGLLGPLYAGQYYVHVWALGFRSPSGPEEPPRPHLVVPEDGEPTLHSVTLLAD